MKPFNGFLLVLFFSLHYMSILSAISSTNMWKVESKKENEKGNGEKKILNGVNNKISKQRQKNTKKKWIAVTQQHEYHHHRQFWFKSVSDMLDGFP